MIRRLISIVIIFLCTAATWIFLSETMTRRTQEFDSKLRQSVGELRGTEVRQEAPTVSGFEDRQRNRTLPIESSNIAVDLNLEHRQKGLLWYSTYRVKFAGRYQITNPSEVTQAVSFSFKLPGERAVYDDFRLLVGGQQVPDPNIKGGKLTKELALGPRQSQSIEVGYITTGLDRWWYDFGSSDNQVKNFSLTVNTDFDQIDFPDDGISPTTKEQTAKGWQLQWTYSNLLSSIKICVAMPHKLNPGPWVSQVSYAAPISLFLFFYLLFIISTVRNIRIHPMNYFFIGASFFSFHLLLAYLVDHVSVHSSFVIASIVSVVLVISYMRLVVGPRFAFVEVGVSQFVLLVLFSYSFFFQGYTGLAITILGIATLFMTMQITGRLDWDAVFRAEKGPQQRTATEKLTSES